MLATRGKEFTPLEIQLNLFYQALMEWRQIKAGVKTAAQKVMENAPDWPKDLIARYPVEIEKGISKAAADLGQRMVNAIAARDDATLFEISEAVKFLKSFKPHGDRIRERLLLLKHLSKEKLLKDGTEREWTISEIARLVEWPRAKSKDGFARLRRLCGDYDLHIAPSRPLRKK
ncbi:MAG: hypothetical protein ABSG78_02440 [Verrucomicrobiota bacterium]|jgi:hypothetical protein